MNWINRLEMKFGRWAIPGLLRYVAVLSSISFILVKYYPHYIEFLVLDRDRLLDGEVWRLITYLFIPSMGGLIYPDWFGMAFYVMFLFWMGDGLEQAWGVFRFNLYFLCGMIGTTCAALIGGTFGGGGIFFMTIFLAFARFYPDAIIRLFFLLPVKVKWLAWLDGALLCLSFVAGPPATKLAIVAGIANYLLFFGREFLHDIKFRKEVTQRRARFQREMREATEDSLHRCKVCGVTENAGPEVEFRVAADGEEYCVAHLPPR